MPESIRSVLRAGFSSFSRGATGISQNFPVSLGQGVLLRIWEHSHFQSVCASERTPGHNQNPFWLGGAWSRLPPGLGHGFSSAQGQQTVAGWGYRVQHCRFLNNLYYVLWDENLLTVTLSSSTWGEEYIHSAPWVIFLLENTFYLFTSTTMQHLVAWGLELKNSFTWGERGYGECSLEGKYHFWDNI